MDEVNASPSCSYCVLTVLIRLLENNVLPFKWRVPLNRAAFNFPRSLNPSKPLPAFPPTQTSAYLGSNPSLQDFLVGATQVVDPYEYMLLQPPHRPHPEGPVVGDGIGCGGVAPAAAAGATGSDAAPESFSIPPTLLFSDRFTGTGGAPTLPRTVLTATTAGNVDPAPAGPSHALLSQAGSQCVQFSGRPPTVEEQRALGIIESALKARAFLGPPSLGPASQPAPGPSSDPDGLARSAAVIEVANAELKEVARALEGEVRLQGDGGFMVLMRSPLSVWSVMKPGGPAFFHCHAPVT